VSVRLKQSTVDELRRRAQRKGVPLASYLIELLETFAPGDNGVDIKTDASALGAIDFVMDK
jgi:hypothetical protein